MTAPSITLEYASRQTTGMLVGRAVFRSLMWLAVMSGLCVGVCFLCFTEHVAAYALHVLIFATTIVIAVRAGVGFARLEPATGTSSNRLRIAFDLIATMGIIGIGIAPVVYVTVPRSGAGGEDVMAVLLGIAYALLACTTARHILFYRVLADMCRSIGRVRMARWLLALGWVKTVYEGVWLACCASALVMIGLEQALPFRAQDVAIHFAFAALIGAMGFTGVWIWMMIAHGLLLKRAR